MSTTPAMPPDRPIAQRRWFMPAFCVFLGVVVGGAALIGDQVGFAIFGFVLMCVLGAVFYFARGSETLQGLGGPERDERWASIDLKATAFAAVVMLVVIIGLWLADLVRGVENSPYAYVLAAAGVSYVIGIAVLRNRS